MPILGGFIDKNYDPPFKCVFEPIGSTRGKALQLINKVPKESDLYDMFVRWCSYIPVQD
jgi:hypothetical protein